MGRWMIFISILLAGCTKGRKYVLVINEIAPDKSKQVEKHSIYAESDSAAYSQATVIYFLALHAYNKTAEESKLYVTRPVNYQVINEQGNEIDSILGREKTDKIRDLKKSLIN